MRSFCATALVGAVCSCAPAQTFWAAPLPGDWSNVANWSPMDVPDSLGEDAVINAPGTYTVTFDVFAASIGALSLSEPNATLVIEASRTLGLSALSHTNNGLIQINPSGSAGNGVLVFNPDNLGPGPVTQTMTGLGVIELSGGINDAQMNTGLGVTLINDIAHSIVGAGELNAALTNNGLVRATSTGFGDVLEIQTENKANTGRFESSLGATLQIEVVTIDQTGGGTIDAVDGAVVFANGANSSILGGSIDNSLGGTVTRLFGTTSLENVTINGPIDIASSGIIEIRGTALTNNSTIAVNNSSGAGNGVLTFAETASINGVGTILLGGGGDDAQLNTEAGIAGTLGAGQSVVGAGQINAALTNNGIIRATSTGFGALLELQTENKVNNARIESSAGATLQIETITIDQTAGGSIDAVDGDILFVNSSESTILGGTIDNSAGGTISRAFGTTVLNSVTIDGPFDILGSGTLAIAGTGLTNNSTIAVNNSSSSGNGVLTFAESGLIDGPGTILLGGGSNDSQLNSEPGATGSIGALQTVAGTGEVNASLVNNGVVRASTTAFGAILEIKGEPKVNNARFESSTGATLRIEAVTIDQTGGGTIDAVNGDVLFLSGTDSEITGGTIESSAGGSITRAFGTTTLRDVTIQDPLVVLPSGAIAVAGSGMTNNSIISVNDSASAGNGIVSFVETGTIDGAGVIFLGGGSDDSQLNTAKGVVGTLGDMQTVIGSGQMNGAFTLLGTLDLGLPSGPSVIRLDGSLELTATSLVRCDLVAPNVHDQLSRTIGSSVTLAGAVEATVDPAYTPMLGHEFNVVGASGPVAGEFDTVTVIGLDPLYELRQVVLPDRMLLRVSNPSCVADLAEPRGSLDFSDVVAFLSYFGAGDPGADLAPPFGSFDFSDVVAFLSAFGAGCP